MSLILELIEAVGLSGAEILRVIDTAPARYRVYPIKKRNGGERIIAQPSRELKAIQHFIMTEKLKIFRVHPRAMAYEIGRGIYDNAVMHQRSNVILKLDFKDFFPSIKVRDWELLAAKDGGDVIPRDEIRLYSKIMFWSQIKRSIIPRCLSIGAPTSPMVSNIIMYELDFILNQISVDLSVIYTRYADDITASGYRVEDVIEFEKRARRIIRQTKSPKLLFNDEKRGIFTKGQRRLVTGLVLTPQKTVSIGRDRKRKISSLLHRSILGQLDDKDRSTLKGLLGFCVSAEPLFLDRLREKYGNDAVNAAMKFHAPKRKDQRPILIVGNQE